MRREKRGAVFVLVNVCLLLLSSCTFLPVRTTSCYTVIKQTPFIGNLIFVKHNTVYAFSSNIVEIRSIANFTGSVANLHISPDGKYLLDPKIREAVSEELPEDAAFLFEQAVGLTTTHYLESLDLIEIQTGAKSHIEVPEMLRAYSLKGWFDREWLLFEPVFGIIQQGFIAFPVIDTSQPKGSIFLFNPFTRQSISIVPNLPAELDPDFLVLPRWWLYPFTYSTDKQRVFFYTHTETGMSKYVLWDITNQRVIWEEALNPVEVVEPAWWSPDGKYIAYHYYDSQRLVLLDMQGTRTRIPTLSEKYVPSHDFSWSPNGQMLAFWIGDLSRKNEIMQPFEFVVYDTKTNAIINTCIISEGTTGEFFWSPDGRFILIAEKSHEYLLLDLQEKRAFRFNFEQGEIIGWMK